MKKALLLALAALAVSAAQAITYTTSWELDNFTSDGITGYNKGNYNTINNVTLSSTLLSGTDLTDATSITLTSISIGMNSPSSMSTTQVAMLLILDSESNVIAANSGFSTTSQTVKTGTSSTGTAGLWIYTFDGVTLDASATYTLVLVDPDTYDAETGTYDLISTTSDDATKLAVFSTTSSNFQVQSGYSAYVSFSGTALVPEPTCLALLALGVAGLALRRRA